MKQNVGLQALFTILFGVAVTLFFGLVYPHHLHHQEQYQLFLFDSNYFCEVAKLPGGVADWLGRFCTQFFLFAWVGAIIMGVLLMAVQLLTVKVFDWGKLYGLSYLPAGLLWLFMLDENAMLGSVWAIIITLLAAWGYQKVTQDWLQRCLLVAAIPILYWIAGPVSILFFLVTVFVSKRFVWWVVSASIVLVLLQSAILPQFIALPADKLGLLGGVHYHRDPASQPLLLWISVLCYLLLPLLPLVLRKSVAASKPAVQYITLGVVALAIGAMVYQNSNLKAERVMAYDFMARHQQWNRIVDTAKEQSPNNGMSVTALNLALAKKGQLVDHMFDYNQNGLSGLLPQFVRDAVSPLTTAEAFYQLGMINTAQRFVFEAQEAIPDYQKSARCYKRLAETNLINGSYEVAKKYLTTLQKTLFYSDWADETIKLLGNEEAINKHQEYGRLRQMRINQDFFFSDRETPQMLGRLFMSNRTNRLAFEYLEAAFLLSGDLDSFVNCVDMGQSLGYPVVPKHFQEALVLWWSRSHGPNDPMPGGQISSSIVKGLDRFYSLIQTPGITNEGLAEQFGNTYWHYYFTTIKK